MIRLIEAARSWARAQTKHHQKAKRVLLSAESLLGLAQHTLAQGAPRTIRPRPRKLTVAVTAHCNLRCVGCRYGRDFMPGHQLSLPVVGTLLDDAKACGIETVRLYGGEPLLHPELPAMIRHGIGLGLSTYVTTNGLLLDRKIEQLYDSGLRNITIGFYGTGADYDGYVQRDNRYRRLEASIAAVRDRYGSSVSMQLNYLLMRPSCNLGSLDDAWRFAQRYDLEFTTDLIHYSLPYFTDGPNHELQFREEDRAVVVDWVTELARLKSAHPERIRESLLSIYSIPDWLLKGADMHVPCDAYKLIWVGADGTVQLCYAAFKLGNLHERRLHQMLFSDPHRQAARDAFALNCPNCHCEREARIMKHVQSRRRYRAGINSRQSGGGRIVD
jgi:MoaA/NifB/PqqE/SkfB family radical SAM enzyme